MNSCHIRMSPGKDVLVLVKHTFKYFQFIRRDEKASIGYLVNAT